jgi:putative ABC transport system permease protein
MFKNYIKIAYRNIIKQPVYSVINITGLALGLACSMILILYIYSESNYDTFNLNADQIVRFTVDGTIGDRPFKGGISPLPLAEALKNDFPEVIASAKLNDEPKTSIIYNNSNIVLDNLFFADDDLSKIFTFEKITGELSINSPNTAIISEKAAAIYFKDKNPIGEVFQLDDNEKTSIKIVGIFRNFPYESHFHPEFIVSYKSYYRYKTEIKTWLGFNTHVYALLKDGYSSESLNKKMPDLVEKYMGKELREYGVRLNMGSQKLTDIHLNSNDFVNEIETAGSKSNIFIMLIIALFVILIASINFMNLSTARSSRRAKEVGIRKVLGAFKSNLVLQFLGESIFLSAIAFILALALVEIFMPIFNNLANREIEFSFINNFPMLLFFMVLTICIGIFAGLYPAFYLSSFEPIAVLKGNLKNNKSASFIRKSLVVLQFTISISLIIGTLIILSQLNFMTSKNLGFDKDQVLVIPLANATSIANYNALKQTLLNNSSISSVSAADFYPGNGGQNNSAFWAEGQTKEISKLIDRGDVSLNYFETLKIDLIYGRYFSDKFYTDTLQSVIINEAAALELGFTENPIGKKIYNASKENEHTIIGLVKNFHYRSLHEKIQPLIFYLQKNASNVLVKIKSENIDESIRFIENKFLEINPTSDFSYDFIDQKFAKYYTEDKRFSSIINTFTFLTIFIACLGLFGLASFMADQKMKEIGIRKILGASMTSIFSIFTSEFSKLILISILLSIPIAYFIMSKWLQNFAYQMEITAWPFVYAALLSILISMLTITYQALKAAKNNPIIALKYE